MTGLLVAAALLFAYPFAIYPLLALLIPSRRRIHPPAGAEPPSAALVICAYNEEHIIASKLENSLALDYPAGRLHVYLVNDGSVDRTGEIGASFAPRGLRFINRSGRRGKAANINEIVPTLEEDVIVLSDANVIYETSALRHLVSRFADPSVGCVSGKVILTDTDDSLRQSEGFYYNIEWMLQQKAADLYSMCGADGAMYAFRRKLFRPYPADTIIEDLVLPLSFVSQGYRVAFEPSAFGWEHGSTSVHEEFRRKVRISAGSFQALARGNGFPRNAPFRFWFIWFSHKFMRWISPLFGLLTLILAFASLDTLAGKLVCGFAVILLAVAALRWITKTSSTLLNIPFYFVFSQLALAVGLCRGLAGRQSVLWDKANR
ncbi:MAG: glycosyltransferase family 2 protein [Bryobacterales bacterium]|nr:glycosyltransferase family 2 protein [Bryobacterales bacterium]